MKKRKFGLLISSLLLSGSILAACGGDKEEGSTDKDSTATDNFTVAMVTDTGGIDDRSFNQSTWEGLKEYATDNSLDESDNGIAYNTSTQESEYVTNLNDLVSREFDLIFAVGFPLHDAVEEVAGQRENAQIAIIDSVVEGLDNVASINFRANEGSYLAGAAAALESKSGKIGFIGGMDNVVIEGFEAGFKAGAEAVNPNIVVDSQYAGSFADVPKGQQIAKAMYDSGVDIIFHASGGTGNGLFQEAIARKKKDANANVWVIGVDRDQYEEGKVDESTNVVMTSVLKQVGIAAKSIAQDAKDGKFPGGENINFGLVDGGVDLADSRGVISEETLAKVAELKQQIIDGAIEVPATR